MAQQMNAIHATSKTDVKYAIKLMNLNAEHAVAYSMSKLGDNAAAWATGSIQASGEILDLEDFFERFERQYYPVHTDIEYREQFRTFKQQKKKRVVDAAIRFQEITYQIEDTISEKDKATTFLAGLRDDIRITVTQFMTMLGHLLNPTLLDVELAGRRYEEGHALAQQSIKVNKVQTGRRRKKFIETDRKKTIETTKNDLSN